MPPRRLPLAVFRHVPREHLGLLRGVFREARVPYFYVDTWRARARWPRPGEVAGAVVLGGPMGVYETAKYPFIKKQLAFLRGLLRRKKPALGVCLGAQLLARALGSRVYPNRAREIGWYPVRLTAAGAKDPLLRPLRRRPVVFQWHGDTFDLPRGAKLLATAPLCRNQAFRYDTNVWALQFHLEVTGDMVRRWLRAPGSARELAQVGPAAMRAAAAGIRHHGRPLKKIADDAFRVFAEMAKKSAA